MLTGDEVKAARARARLTQEQAAQAAGVTLRTWGNWERSAELTPGNEARVREVLGHHLVGEATASPLSSVSDAQLLAEIAARFDRGRQTSHVPAPTTRAGESPAVDLHYPTPGAGDVVGELIAGMEDPAAASAAQAVADAAARATARKPPAKRTRRA